MKSRDTNLVVTNSQVFRLKTIYSITTEFNKNCAVIKQKFLNRQYKEEVLDEQIEKVDRTERKELFKVKSLSIKVFAATISSYGVNAKLYGYGNGLKLSGLAMVKSKSELKLKRKFLELLTSQICRNYFQAMIFSLNKFTITSRH